MLKKKNTHTSRPWENMCTQPTAWETWPSRMLLYHVYPCEIEQQLYRVGTERPPSSPKSRLPYFSFSSLVTICPHPWPISSCHGCKGVTVHLYQMVWQKEGCGILAWCFSHFNMHTNPCMSCSNADPTSLVLSSPEIAFPTCSQDPSNAPGLWPGPHLVKHESKTYWFSSKMHLRGGKLSNFVPNLLENCLHPVFCLGQWHFGFWEIDHRTIK